MMTIRKHIKAEILREIIKLPEDIANDAILELTIREAAPDKTVSEPAGRKRTAEELIRLFHSRIRAASPEVNFTEEVFSLEEVEWRDLNEVMAHFEEEGYGVKIHQQGNRVQLKILWRYV